MPPLPSEASEPQRAPEAHGPHDAPDLELEDEAAAGAVRQYQVLQHRAELRPAPKEALEVPQPTVATDQPAEQLDLGAVVGAAAEAACVVVVEGEALLVNLVPELSAESSRLRLFVTGPVLWRRLATHNCGQETKPLSDLRFLSRFQHQRQPSHHLTAAQHAQIRSFLTQACAYSFDRLGWAVAQPVAPAEQDPNDPCEHPSSAPMAPFRYMSEGGTQNNNLAKNLKPRVRAFSLTHAVRLGARTPTPRSVSALRIGSVPQAHHVLGPNEKSDLPTQCEHPKRATNSPPTP